MKKQLIIIDISNFIFRAFYAIRILNAPDGTPVNAVHGVLSMILKLLSKYRPTHIVLARDSKGSTFRNEIYGEYKANRKDPPEELIPQFDLIERLIEKMKIPSCLIKNYEADDVIGSMAMQWKNSFDQIFIASGDKDLMQFASDKIKILDTMKDIIYGPKEVYEKLGVYPNQIVDYLSIVGDSSDNIPGMKGIGAKGAVKLLSEYQTLENCIKNQKEFTNKRIKNAFVNHIDDAFLSKKLIKIVTNLDLKMKANDSKFALEADHDLINYLADLGFNTNIKKINELTKSGRAGGSTLKNTENPDLKIKNVKTDSKFAPDNFKVTSIENNNDLINFEKKLSRSRKIATYFEFDDDCSIEEGLVALSISFDGVSAFFIDNLLMVKKILKILFKDSKTEILSTDVKKIIIWCHNQKIKIKANIFDILQAHFIIDVSNKHDLNNSSKELLKYDLPIIEDKKRSLRDIGTEKKMQFCGKRVVAVFHLADLLRKKLKENDLEKTYNDIDEPLINVLASMENEGICLNLKFLKKLENDFTKELQKIEKSIFTEAGLEVNLNSPKQVSELLFDKLNLPPIKKTKTGLSTDSEVLKELGLLGISEVPGNILKYRELEKLLSTYIKVLPNLVNPKTKRVHTHFNQNVVATGRLSSDRPNLQNIPIRTKNGRLVRKAFIAAPRKVLISADYSQVELRILAHLSGDEILIKSFLDDEDVHSQTAAEVFEIPIGRVTEKNRTVAKAVNFGIMYGQSSFGLARTLGISRSEAKEYITNYFQKFPKVKSYLDSLKEFCEQHGYSETMFGRKRFLPDIYAKNRTVKAMAERMAVNSPIQGTAADIIKMAMINIDKEIRNNKLESKMILQVHDELIFEVHDDEVKIMEEMIKRCMENVIKLAVPLKVHIGIGINLFDLK